ERSGLSVMGVPPASSGCSHALPGSGSLHEGDERLADLDDVGRELRPDPRADVAHRVDRAGRDGERVAGLVDRGGAALHLVLERALDDEDDLLAEMGVPWRDVARIELDPVLDHLAARDAEIVPLEIHPSDPRLLDCHLVSSSALRLEGRAQLRAEQLRMLPGSEVTAPV